MRRSHRLVGTVPDLDARIARNTRMACTDEFYRLESPVYRPVSTRPDWLKAEGLW
jgi:hypothetical protein